MRVEKAIVDGPGFVAGDDYAEVTFVERVTETCPRCGGTVDTERVLKRLLVGLNKGTTISSESTRCRDCQYNLLASGPA